MGKTIYNQDIYRDAFIFLIFSLFRQSEIVGKFVVGQTLIGSLHENRIVMLSAYVVANMFPAIAKSEMQVVWNIGLKTLR